MNYTSNPQQQTIEQEIVRLVNAFIEKWLPEHYAHLVDSDDNDGEKLRQQLLSLVNSEKIKELESIYDAATSQHYAMWGTRISDRLQQLREGEK